MTYTYGCRWRSLGVFWLNPFSFFFRLSTITSSFVVNLV
jgi:hypothetical protein